MDIKKYSNVVGLKIKKSSSKEKHANLCDNQFHSRNFARKNYVCPILIRHCECTFSDAALLEFHPSTTALQE